MFIVYNGNKIITREKMEDNQNKSKFNQLEWKGLNVIKIMVYIAAGVVATMLIPSLFFIITFPMMSFFAALSGGNGELYYFWKVTSPTPMQQVALVDLLMPIVPVLVVMLSIILITSLVVLIYHYIEAHKVKLSDETNVNLNMNAKNINFSDQVQSQTFDNAPQIINMYKDQNTEYLSTSGKLTNQQRSLIV